MPLQKPEKMQEEQQSSLRDAQENLKKRKKHKLH